MYPVGHTGLTEVTVLVVLPLTQVMVIFAGALEAGETVAAGVGVTVTTGVAEGAGVGASCESFT